MDAALFTISIALMFGLYLYGYWKHARNLLRRWRVIPKWEEWDRQRRGLCGKCGYDMRATPQKCPECGTPRG